MDGLKHYLDRQVKKFSFADVKLLQLLGASLGVVLVKLVPGILDLNLWVFVVLAALCAAKPCCVFFLTDVNLSSRKEQNEHSPA